MKIRVENNSKFVRGKKKALESIEMDLECYGLKKLPDGKWDYLISVVYENKEDLEKTVKDLFSEMASTADNRNCIVEAEAYCKELNLRWKNTEISVKILIYVNVNCWFYSFDK